MRVVRSRPVAAFSDATVERCGVEWASTAEEAADFPPIKEVTQVHSHESSPSQLAPGVRFQVQVLLIAE